MAHSWPRLDNELSEAQNAGCREGQAAAPLLCRPCATDCGEAQLELQLTGPGLVTVPDATRTVGRNQALGFLAPLVVVQATAVQATAAYEVGLGLRDSAEDRYCTLADR